MNIQELSTCKQYRCTPKIVNLNNRYLGMVRQWQQLEYGGRYSESYMDALPDFVRWPRATGTWACASRSRATSSRRCAKPSPNCATDWCSWISSPTRPRSLAHGARRQGLTEMLLGAEDL